MANIVEISDFVGEFQLQEDVNTTNKFDAIRDEWERYYVRQMLGVELGNLFLADFDANGPGNMAARFEAIYNAFQEDTNDLVVESRGMKFMMKCLMWFYYARQNNVVISTGGNKSKKSENSTPSNEPYLYAKNFNNGVRTAHAIQWYCRDNSSDYPEYNGQRIDFISI